MDRVAIKQRIHKHQTAESIPPCPTISFRHPAYKDPDNILFRLPRLDHPEHTSTLDRSPPQTQTEPGTVTGVHHRTALLACQIVANNAFHGYLAIDRDGQDVVVVGPDGILTNETYWFIANRQDGDDTNRVEGRDIYPVVPRFEEWAFPHESFSALGWDAPAESAERQMSTTSTTFAVPPLPRPIYQRCVISDSSYSIHKAHLVPSGQTQWFQANAMIQYGDPVREPLRFIDNSRNILYMRHDLHTVWDSYMFALVPKRHDFVVHVLATPTPSIDEFAAEWHNIPVQEGGLQGTGKAYLFAKFAQAVFMLLKPFIAYSSSDKYIARRQAQPIADGPLQDYEMKLEWLSGSSLRNMFGGGRSKSASASSSRKRSRSQAEADDELSEEGRWYERNARGRLWACDSDDELQKEKEGTWYEKNARGRLWACESDDGFYQEPEEERRGRPRKRRQRRDRSGHTVDTLPSLTDTSAIGVDSDLTDSFQDGSGLPAPLMEPPGRPRPDKDLTDGGVIDEA